MKAQLSPILGLDEPQSPYQFGRVPLREPTSRRIPSPPGMAWLGRGTGEQAPETPKIDSDVFGQSEASSGGFHTPVCAPSRSRGRADRRLDEACPSVATGHRDPATTGRLINLPFVARKASRR